MSRRRNYAEGEYDELQRLKDRLKKQAREISKLRKEIARYDLDRFQSFKEALDRLDEIEMEQEAKKQDKLVSKEKWNCWSCNKGLLRLKIWDRHDGQHYHRVCDNPDCGKRTSMKKYTPEVKE